MELQFLAIGYRLFRICQAANTKLFSAVLPLQLQKDE